MKTKKVTSLTSTMIAAELRKVATDFATRADYLMLDDGEHRKTWCACVYQLMETLSAMTSCDEPDFDQLSFLDEVGFFQVADHESMANWTYSTKREMYLDEI